MYVKALFEVWKVLGRLGIKNKDLLGVGGDIVKMGKSLFNTRVNPKLLEFIAKNQKIPTKILENIKLHARTLKNASESQKNLFLANIKEIYKAKTPKIPKSQSPGTGIKQLETSAIPGKKAYTYVNAKGETRIMPTKKWMEGAKKAIKEGEDLPPDPSSPFKGWTPKVIKGGKDGLATGGIANHFRAR